MPEMANVADDRQKRSEGRHREDLCEISGRMYAFCCISLVAIIEANTLQVQNRKRCHRRRTLFTDP
jgi:hypothetical protein